MQIAHGHSHSLLDAAGAAGLVLLLSGVLAGCGAGPSASPTAAWTMPMTEDAASGGRSDPLLLGPGVGEGVFGRTAPLGVDGKPIYASPAGGARGPEGGPDAGSSTRAVPGEPDEDDEPGVTGSGESPGPELARGHGAGGPRWWTDEVAAGVEARRLGRGMVIDYWASWCPGCRVLEATTLSDPTVSSALESWFVPVKLDVSEDTALTKARLDSHHVYALPAILVLDAQGHELGRLGRYLPPEEFLVWLAAARALLSSPPPEQRTARAAGGSGLAVPQARSGQN